MTQSPVPPTGGPQKRSFRSRLTPRALLGSRILPWTLFVLALLIRPQPVPPPAPAPTPAPWIGPAQTALPVRTDIGEVTTPELESFMQQQLQSTPFNGSVLVAKNGKVLLRRGYGLANRTYDVPNSPATHFNIGSLTKEFTAMAVLILQNQGKLNVQDPVCKYVPDCPGAWGPITIHHLLTHESGLPSDFSQDEQLQALLHDWTATDQLPTIKKKQLEYQPGSKANYGSVDYLLLSAIIEHLSGQEWGDFVRTSILEPLGMHDTLEDPNRATAPIVPILKDRASSYAPTGSAYGGVLFTSMRPISGAGALVSTVSDMYLWDQALYTDKLVPQALLDLMFKPNEGGFGYGWQQTGGQFEGHPGAANTGTAAGFISLHARLTDEKVVVLELSNVAISGDVRDKIGGELARLAVKAT